MTPIEEAIAAYHRAKNKAARAREEVLAAEVALIDLIGEPDPDHSTAHHTASHKITLKAPYRRSFDKAWATLRDNIPAAKRPERIKYELDTRAYKALAVENPDLYRKVSAAVTGKPGKISVIVDELKTAEVV